MRQSSGDATSVSTDKVAEADVYLGIFTWHYGYVPLGEMRSVTHLEYLEACRLACWLFLENPDTRYDEALLPVSLRNPDHLSHLLAFRFERPRAERISTAFM